MPVRYSRFLGLDNSNDPVKHSSGNGAIKLSKAENVDISRTFSVKRRNGYSLFKSGQYSSLWGNGKNSYAVNNGHLVEILSSGYEKYLKYYVGSQPMSFVDSRTGFVYFTNGLTIGKIKNGVCYDLGSTNDKFKVTLPSGNFLSYLAPRLLVIRNNVIFISDAVNKDVYHQISGFIQFDSEIRMVAPVGQNLFVSDSSHTWFLQKMQNQIDIPSVMFQLKKVAGYPSIRGNPVKLVDNIQMEKLYFSDAALWTSEEGICIGSSDGSFLNLTDSKYNMPSLMRTAYVEHIKGGDTNNFISVIKGV